MVSIGVLWRKFVTALAVGFDHVAIAEPAPVDAIRAVVLFRALGEMGRIAAWRVIAGVEYQKKWVDVTVRKRERQSVRDNPILLPARAATESAIPIRSKFACPKPATFLIWFLVYL